MRSFAQRGIFLLAPVLAACSGPASRPPPAGPTSVAPASAPTTATAICAKPRRAIAVGRDGVAQLPRRLKTLLALLAGQVEVDRAKYELLLRSHPAAGFNPRWNHRRARFSTLSIGPTGTQLDLQARDLSDTAELMRRLSVFKDEPPWDLLRTERVGRWVRVRLELDSSPRKASEKCPSGTSAPDPTDVKIAELSWKPMPPQQVGPWKRTGLETMVSGGLAELQKRFTTTKLPDGVSGVQISLNGANAAVALHWHTAGAAATPAVPTPLMLQAVLPDQPLPPTTLPFPRRGTGWDLSAVPWIKRSRRKELVRHLELLERSDLMRRQMYMHALTDARKGALSELTRCLPAALSTAGDEETGEFPKTAISRVSFRLRGDTVRLKATVPGTAHVRKARQVLRKHDACEMFRGAKVGIGAKPTSLELTANLPRPKIDPKSYERPVGKLAIPRGKVNEIQRRAFWEEVQHNHMAVNAFANKVWEERRELGKRLGSELTVGARLASFHAQAELAGVDVMVLRTHPRRVDGPLRHRAIDIEANGPLPQVMRFVLQIQSLYAVSLPAYWTWQARKGKQGGQLELRLFLISFVEPTAGG